MPQLSDYAQFILVKLTWSETLKKWEKLPVNAAGVAINPLDATQWMSYDKATALAGVSMYSLGFVLTETDPFFCLDIDQCLLPDGSDWSPLAYDVIHAAGGGMVEVSHSGRGLHIWGTYHMMPAHKCKNTAARLELYHEKRFILLGNNQSGNIADDLTAMLPGVINRWFKPDPTDRNGTAEWTSEPCESWAGPLDDDELIAKALASVNASSVFGATVTFKDLWEANEDALAAVWPDPMRAYDASSADAALAQRLAFWTGRDCERMQRLMLRSALYREKYDRADYLPRTILGACSRQVAVYNKATHAEVDRMAATGGWVS